MRKAVVKDSEFDVGRLGFYAMHLHINPVAQNPLPHAQLQDTVATEIQRSVFREVYVVCPSIERLCKYGQNFVLYPPHVDDNLVAISQP